MSIDLKNKNIGIGITGSYCTFATVFSCLEELTKTGANFHTIFSFNAAKTNTRFGEYSSFLKKAKDITGNEPITTIEDAEPIGPNNLLDLMIILPCTGNSLAKLANGITDTPVLMAAKAHIRNNKPLLIFLSTNDALGANFKNIATLFNTKNVFFIPFGQDNYKTKPNSMISNINLIEPAIVAALNNKQLQPVITK